MSKRTIWEGLDHLGFSDKAKAAIMGNAQQESGNETDRVQGDFSTDRRLSREYTAKVDSGEISREDFVFHGLNGGGYGWLQWTFWSRKDGLYAKAKELGVSIGSEEAALAWFWEELQHPEYSGVLQMLRSDASLREMTAYFMLYYERPADQSIAAQNVRVKFAEEILAKFSGQEDEPDKPETFWPPRVLCLGMKGTDVQLLQASLACHGFNPGSCSGVFDTATEQALRNYQEKNFDLDGNRLQVDGISGKKSFNSLFKF